MAQNVIILLLRTELSFFLRFISIKAHLINRSRTWPTRVWSIIEGSHVEIDFMNWNYVVHDLEWPAFFPVLTLYRIYIEQSKSSLVAFHHQQCGSKLIEFGAHIYIRSWMWSSKVFMKILFSNDICVPYIVFQFQDIYLGRGRGVVPRSIRGEGSWAPGPPLLRYCSLSFFILCSILSKSNRNRYTWHCNKKR